MARLFLSYSHADENALTELRKHLSALQRSGEITAWYDRLIFAGDSLDDAVMAELELADVVLLLVSADFINSDYCYGIEMKRALERRLEGTCRVIPVIIRACAWQMTPLKELRATPRDGKAVAAWKHPDEAYLYVVQDVRAALSPKPASPKVEPTAAPSTLAPAQVQASSVSRSFTDRDRTNFVHEAFDALAPFFKSSIDALHQLDATLEGDVRSADGERFGVVLYRNGSSIAKCAVFVNRTFSAPSICFSNEDTGSNNSWNEQLSPATDKASLFFTAMTSPGTKMTPQDTAEHLWKLFVQRI